MLSLFVLAALFISTLIVLQSSVSRVVVDPQLFGLQLIPTLPAPATIANNAWVKLAAHIPQTDVNLLASRIAFVDLAAQGESWNVSALVNLAADLAAMVRSLNVSEVTSLAANPTAALAVVSRVAYRLHHDLRSTSLYEHYSRLLPVAAAASSLNDTHLVIPPSASPDQPLANSSHRSWIAVGVFVAFAASLVLVYALFGQTISTTVPKWLLNFTAGRTATPHEGPLLIPGDFPIAIVADVFGGPLETAADDTEPATSLQVQVDAEQDAMIDVYIATMALLDRLKRAGTPRLLTNADKFVLRRLVKVLKPDRTEEERRRMRELATLVGIGRCMTTTQNKALYAAVRFGQRVEGEDGGMKGLS
ncbi:hypothetical protein HMN09_01352000 [Mycena chlorophos]|uniref:Uncharacterized protein n=1 Tax=Mycena chlorophos TaxID=658473 RepID=A0A8H6RXC3_MYCCL|nr:hypothetical protein HMN09_01352000 [Mycena chlorophos]